jgi:hypothetical protein
VLVGDGERDGPAARPDVEDPRLGDRPDPGEAALDDDLGLRARDEDTASTSSSSRGIPTHR